MFVQIESYSNSITTVIKSRIYNIIYIYIYIYRERERVKPSIFQNLTRPCRRCFIGSQTRIEQLQHLPWYLDLRCEDGLPVNARSHAQVSGFRSDGESAAFEWSQLRLLTTCSHLSEKRSKCIHYIMRSYKIQVTSVD